MKRKRTSSSSTDGTGKNKLTLQDKFDIVNALADNTMSRRDACQKYGISQSAITYIISRKKEILRLYNDNLVPRNNKRMLLPSKKREIFEDKVLEFIHRAQNLFHETHVLLTVPMILMQAKTFAEDLQMKINDDDTNPHAEQWNPDFSWFTRFRKRRGVQHVRLQGEWRTFKLSI